MVLERANYTSVFIFRDCEPLATKVKWREKAGYSLPADDIPYVHLLFKFSRSNSGALRGRRQVPNQHWILVFCFGRVFHCKWLPPCAIATQIVASLWPVGLAHLAVCNSDCR